MMKGKQKRNYINKLIKDGDKRSFNEIDADLQITRFRGIKTENNDGITITEDSTVAGKDIPKDYSSFENEAPSGGTRGDNSGN